MGMGTMRVVEWLFSSDDEDNEVEWLIDYFLVMMIGMGTMRLIDWLFPSDDGDNEIEWFSDW